MKSEIENDSSTELLKTVRKYRTQQEVADYLNVTTKTVSRWESGVSEPKQVYMTSLLNMLYPIKDELGNHEFTFIDLFAGIGGLRKAFESQGGKCVFTCEWDSYAQKTYRENFIIDHHIQGDIQEITDKSKIPDHDVLLAGFPCQPFSIAGVSKKQSLGRKHGFEDEAQGTLFFDILQILKVKKPKAFLLENVKNLCSHDKGKTFKVIVNSLKELGYKLGNGDQTHRIIDAKHFVPQHRERTFIVGFLEETGFSWNDIRLPALETGPKMNSILHTQDGSEKVEERFTTGHKAKVLPKYTLSDKLWNYLQNYAAKHKAKGNGFGFGMIKPNDTCRTLSARYYKDGSEILVYQGDNKNPRRLTPRECARLMGFDSDGNEFKIPVSDTRAYKQFGNSVVVPVVKEVARVMKPHIMALKQTENSKVQQTYFNF